MFDDVNTNTNQTGKSIQNVPDEKGVENPPHEDISASDEDKPGQEQTPLEEPQQQPPQKDTPEKM